MRTRAGTVAGLVALLLAGAACGSGSTGPAGSDDAGSDDAVPRALAALAAEHLDVPPVAAAPLGRDQGVVPPSVGVELAAPWTDGDNAHLVVQVLAGRAGERQWRQARCAPRQERCQESSKGGGGGLLVQWDPLAYESDPGSVTVLVRRADRTVVGIGFHGPPIPRRRPDDLVVTTLDELVALATDPDVSTTPPASAVADGAALGDGVWLEWYGQGNGAPSPSS